MKLETAISKVEEGYSKGKIKTITFVEEDWLGIKHKTVVTASRQWFDENTPPPTIVVRRYPYKPHLPLKHS
jgi:hypothetical protein